MAGLLSKYWAFSCMGRLLDSHKIHLTYIAQANKLKTWMFGAIGGAYRTVHSPPTSSRAERREKVLSAARRKSVVSGEAKECCQWQDFGPEGRRRMGFEATLDGMTIFETYMWLDIKVNISWRFHFLYFFISNTLPFPFYFCALLTKKKDITPCDSSSSFLLHFFCIIGYRVCEIHLL